MAVLLDGDFASGAASSMGTVFPFTLNDETLIDITQEMVVTNYAGGASFNNSSALAQLWKQGFWGFRPQRGGILIVR